jgi:NIPSNAP
VLYEMRTYEVVPGRMPQMHARFANHTLGFFRKHGIRVVGFWEAAIGTSNVLHYLLSWDDLAHRERAWSAFQSDPEWHRVRDESQRDGPIVARVRNEIWQATAYSPMK